MAKRNLQMKKYSSNKEKTSWVAGWEMGGGEGGVCAELRASSQSFVDADECTHSSHSWKKYSYIAVIEQHSLRLSPNKQRGKRHAQMPATEAENALKRSTVHNKSA